MALLNQKEINKLIASARKHGKQWQDDVQELCIQATGHVLMHGNIMPAVSIANDLLAAMPEGGRKQAIVSYLEAVGFLKYHAKTKTSAATFKFYDKVKKAPAPFSCEKVWTDEYEQMMRLIPWYSFSKEKVTTTHTILGDVESFLKTMGRRFAAPEGQEAPKDHELLSFLSEALADYKALRAEQAAEAKKNAEALNLDFTGHLKAA